MDILALQGSITLDTSAYERAVQRAANTSGQLSAGVERAAVEIQRTESVVSNVGVSMQQASADMQAAVANVSQSAENQSETVGNAADAIEVLAQAEREAQRQGERLSNTQNDNNQTTQQTEQHTQSLVERMTLLQARYQESKDAVKELTEKYLESVRTTGENSEATQQLGTQLTEATERTNQLRDEMQALRNPVAEVADNTEELGENVQDTNNQSNEFANTIKNAVSVTLGNLFTQAITKAKDALVGFAKQSIESGMSFDSAMSQVAATMGVTTDEVQDLRKYAQDMGATTAFSATQAADALNYMALAGYDSEKSMAMLPNVLNLAAAGGMDLALASDMVTDAQSALGLTMDETTQMVNKMAMTASKSNTSVSQLGNAFLQIGGTAKKLKGGTTELATILGILADNGMKGAEGGTHLRNMMNSLMSPTKDAKAMMSELNISLYDTEGNMRSLNDVFLDIRERMSEMATQQERDNVLTTLFNARDLKAAEALVAGVGQRYEELSGYIDDAAESAQNMADTQLDNLAGDITLFKSAVEGAQIAVSDRLTPTLRKFTQFGSQAVSEMSEAFGKNGLEGAVTAAHKVIYNELGTKSAVAIYSVETATKAALAALVSYQAFVKAAAIEKFFTDAATGAVSLAAGINKAKSAIAALNISPTVAGFTALAAVGVAIASAFNAATDAIDEVGEPLQGLTGQEEEFAKRVREATAALDESSKSWQSSVRNIEIEEQTSQKLIQRLYELNDGEEKTAETKSEMAMIVEELTSSVEGLNIKYDEETGLVKTARKEVEELTNSYYDQAKAQAYKDIYSETIKKQTEAELDLKDAMQLKKEKEREYLNGKDYINTAKKHLAAAQAQLKSEIALQGTYAQNSREEALRVKRIGELNTVIADTTQTIREMEASQVENTNAFNEATIAANAAQKTYNGYTNRLQDIEEKVYGLTGSTVGLSEVQEDAAETATEAVKKTAHGFQAAGEEIEDAVVKLHGKYVALNEENATEVAEWLDYYDELYNKQLETIQKSIDLFSGTETHIDPLDKSELKKNLSDSLFVIEDWGKAVEQLQAKVDAGNMSQDLLDSIKGMDIEDARQYLYMFNRQMSDYELKQYSDMWDKVQSAQEEAAQKATAKQQAEIEENIQKITGAVNASIDDVKAAFQKAGLYSAQGYADGVKNNIKLAKNAVSNGSDGLADEVDAAMHDSVLDYGSPSKRFIEYGKWTVSGLAKGIYNNIDMVIDAVNYTGRTATDEMKTALDIKDSISGKFAELGKNTVEGFAKGIKDNLELAANVVNDLAQKTIDTLKDKLGIASPSKIFRELGSYSGDGFALGFDDSESTVIKAAAGMADSAYNAVESFEPSNYISTVESTQNGAQGASIATATMPETVHITLMLQSGQVLADTLFPFMDIIQGREARLSSRGY